MSPLWALFLEKTIGPRPRGFPVCRQEFWEPRAGFPSSRALPGRGQQVPTVGSLPAQCQPEELAGSLGAPVPLPLPDTLPSMCTSTRSLPLSAPPPRASLPSLPQLIPSLWPTRWEQGPWEPEEAPCSPAARRDTESVRGPARCWTGRITDWGTLYGGGRRKWGGGLSIATS